MSGYLIKSRFRYALTVIVLIVLGLSSRKFASHLPVFIADHSGDMLWAAMVYFGLRCLFINKGIQWAFAGSLLFSFFIEFSQLYQAAWINEIRSTTLGALVLGRGFLIVDLIRYLFGITISYFADGFILKKRVEKTVKV
jgi:glycopeptide antibiotics resistance protein